VHVELLIEIEYRQTIRPAARADDRCHDGRTARRAEHEALHLRKLLRRLPPDRVRFRAGILAGLLRLACRRFNHLIGPGLESGRQLVALIGEGLMKLFVGLNACNSVALCLDAQES
jgi:hypothetical protein